MNLHKLLKELRVAAGYTQQNIADLLSLDRSTYAYYENGKISPPVNKLVILARLYKISLDRLVHDESAHEPMSVHLSSPELSPEEKAETEEFRNLTRDEQQLILSYRAFSKKEEFLDLIAQHLIDEET